MQESVQAPAFVGNRFSVYVAAASLAIVLADYWSGPHVNAPILFAFPVILAAWFGRIRTSLLLAFGLPIIRLIMVVVAWRIVTTFPEAFVNAVTSMAALAGLSYLARRAGLSQRLQERVKVLEGILPICSFCKRIRDADEHWHSLEKYISERSEAAFTHGLCPECVKKHYPESLDD